jgi:hypothetical protein
MNPVDLIGFGALALSAIAGISLLLRCVFSVIPEHALSVLYGVYIIGAVVAFIILSPQRLIAFYYGLSLLAASGILGASLLIETFGAARNSKKLGQMSALAIFNLVAGMIMYLCAMH